MSNSTVQGPEDCTLPKGERLFRRGDIGRLFAQGEAFLVYPVKCTYLVRTPEDGSAGGRALNRVMVMAPKRNHKRAVARNLLKRRMREAYRLHKHLLPASDVGKGVGYDLSLSYIAKDELLDYRTIEHAVVRILNKLCTIATNIQVTEGSEELADE